MTDIVSRLVGALKARDAQRSRSTQVSIGPSEMGGCRRRIWYRLNGAEGNNETISMPAIMGTAIHHAIEDAFAGTEGIELEVELASGNVVGHIDLIDVHNKAIWDWKTTTKASLGYFPSQQQIAQVQVYGYLAKQNGYDVETVGLVAIPRDGDENDILVYQADYDESIAIATIDRAHEVAGYTEPPAPEKEAQFCKKYCAFFDICGGKQASNSENEQLIADIDVDVALHRYIELNAVSKQITAELDGIKRVLDGSSGITTDGIRLKWTEVSGRTSVDEAEVVRLIGFVPKKVGTPYYRMNVTETK